MPQVREAQCQTVIHDAHAGLAVAIRMSAVELTVEYHSSARIDA
jgi:hypothetical protein